MPFSALIDPDNWLTWPITVLYAATILSCIIVVISENRNPIRSLAWVIALIFLPFIGLVFYLFFGRSLKGMHIISRRNKRRLMKQRSGRQTDLESMGMNDSQKQLAKLSYNLSSAPVCVNNAIKIYTDGHSKFESLIKDLHQARESIFLQYYIFNDDTIGRQISDILIEKALQGITVRVLYDHVGSFSARNRFFKRMKEAGVEVHPFFKVTFPQLANRINWRNHRKIVVIDNRISYIGGMNIADRYNCGPDSERPWRDTHFRLEGDITEQLFYSFSLDWNFQTQDPSPYPFIQTRSPVKNTCGMQLVTGGPSEQYDNLALVFLNAIANAKKSIYIQTPYFLPTDSLVHALEAAALAKVDVRIMLPGKSDSKILQMASCSYVTQCLRAGIKVYFYNPGMLHAKSLVIDDDIVSAGSTNFDFRSFENNFECNLMIYDAGVNRQMRDIFFRDMQLCSRPTLTQWIRRPMSRRVMESLLRLTAPIL